MNNKSVTISIKPYYKGETLNYIVGMVEKLNLHVIQATDTGGFLMGTPGKTDEKHPATAVFGITKEEFELKDKDRAKLDDLAFTLMHELPRDRIIAENNLRTEGRAETIDNGKYAKEKAAELEEKKKSIINEDSERAKKLIGEIIKNESAYFVYTKGAGKVVPTIDSTGAALLFSKEEYARELVKNSESEVELDVQRMDKNGINLFFQNLFRFGILSVKVDAGTSEGGVVARDQAINFHGLKEYSLINSMTVSLIIRYLQAKQLKKEEDQKKSCSVLWNAFARSFPNGCYIIPFYFDGDGGNDIEQKEVFFSEKAVSKLKENKPAILGIEQYKPSMANGRVMKVISIKKKSENAEQSYLPVYTDIPEFRAAFGDKARPFFLTFEDIYEKHTSFDGIVINSASLFFAVTTQGMENIAQVKERAESEKQDLS